MLCLLRHDAAAEDLPVTLVVRPEQAVGEVIAAAVPLAQLGIDFTSIALFLSVY